VLESWPKAILLDFYGTIVEDIRLPVREICDRISSASAKKIDEAVVVSYWGKVFARMCSESHGAAFHLQKVLEQLSLKDALSHFDINLDSLVLSQTISDYRAHPRIFPESQSVLSRCLLPLCLVTNIDNAEIYSAVQYLNLHFNHIVTSEDCKAYKPRKEAFEKALALLGQKAEDVLHVGDSLQSDVKGAQNLGIPVLWIDRRKRPLDSWIKPEYIADSLSGLLDIPGIAG
jgi:2-haloalkanoic acid dehalogenase type II